jgi:hypothetical protein
LNNTARAVSVEYMPFSFGAELDGDLNLTMLIQFNARYFGLDASLSSSKFIIKINDIALSID